MIDRATIDRIIDTAEIVDVVSDFISLKRAGANYKGLCPFHNDHTPSFSVSPARNICKCFVCGEGGSPVNFIMKHENLGYYDALRYLAKKYHIEIQERELSDEEKQAQTERESMFTINEFAAQFFEQQLSETQEGIDVGMSYFNDRGFTAESIKTFRLGYSPDKRSALYDAAIAKGYNRQMLFDVGLCIDDNRGGGYDRFRGRVMFPVMTTSGKIVAFGGRTLKGDKAKYVNSPESAIYKKSNEIYGMYQAKRDISREDKCFIVEGYADVISMHQSGFKNVIASSGTALTTGHIKTISRFTKNVTELFDGDAAGIKAALRGVDMLLAEGLNIKILPLPDGEDPDSFSQSHSASEVKEYIDANETDFINFKMSVLLKESEGDPIKKAAVITDVVKSIAVIPDNIQRAVYTQECSTRLEIAEDILLKEVSKHIALNRDAKYREQKRNEEREQRSIEREQEAQQQAQQADTAQAPADHPTPSTNKQKSSVEEIHYRILKPCEQQAIRLVAKYGMNDFCPVFDSNNQVVDRITLIEFIAQQLDETGMSFSIPAYDKIFKRSRELVDAFYNELPVIEQQINDSIDAKYREGVEQIRQQDLDSDMIEKKEAELNEQLTTEKESRIKAFRNGFIAKRLCSDEDDEVREVSFKLIVDREQLSKIHTQFATIQNEVDRLITLVPEAIYNWQGALVRCQIKDVQAAMARDPQHVEEYLTRLQELSLQQAEIAKYINRVVNPI